MLLSRIGGRATAATALGAICALVLLWVHVAGVVPSPVIAVVGAAAILAVPVSREFSRRVAIVLLTALGWAPLVWLGPWPGGQLTRVGGVTAVLVGVLVGWVALGPVRERLSRLVPRFRRIDAVALGGVGLVIAYLWPVLRLRSAPETMGVVLGGWDHVGHYDMTRMIVHEGRLIPLIPVGDMGPLYYDSYPQGLHSTVAMLVELREGVGGGSGIGEIAAYLQATTIVYAATLTTVICCLCSVPAVRRRPVRAAWAVGALLVSWLVSPGGAVLHEAGFDNFLLASAGVACLPMLVAMSRRVRFSGVTVAASGAVLAVAHNWVLLLPMAAVGVLAVAWPLRRRRFPAEPAQWLPLGALAVTTGVGVLAAGWQVLSAHDATHLLTAGGFPTHNLAGYAVPIAAGLWGAAVVRGPLGWASGGATLIVGVAEFVWVASAQLAATGEVGYYGIKLLTADMLVALTLLGVLVAVQPPVRFGFGRSRHVAIGALVALALLVTSFVPLLRQGSDFPSVRVRQAWAATPGDNVESSTRLLQQWLSLASPRGGLVFLPGESADPVLSSQLNLWQAASRGMWTQQAERCWPLSRPTPGPLGTVHWVDREHVAAAVREILQCCRGVSVALPSPELEGVIQVDPGLVVHVLASDRP